MDFNSTEFAWKDMEVVVLGRPLVRILELKYKRVKKPIMGRGSKPVGIQKGNYTYSGTMKIGQSELIALEAAVGDLLANTFDISVAYRQTTTTVSTSRKRIVGVDIEGYEEGMAQGDTDMEISLSFQCMDIITV